MISESGRSLHALTAIRPANPGTIIQGATKLDGSFAFQQLPSGIYTFCARVPSDQFPRPDQPYLDTCVWEQAQVPVPLISGQNLAGARIVVPQAAVLKVRIDDPDKVLPPFNARAAASSTQLQLVVSGPNRMAHHLDFTAQDSAGRDYSAAVPVGAALSFSASSSLGRLIDQAGQPLAAPVNASAATGSGPAPLKFTLRRN